MSQALRALFPQPQQLERYDTGCHLPAALSMRLRTPDDGMIAVAEHLSGWLAELGLVADWTAYVNPLARPQEPAIQLQRCPGMFALAGAYRLSIQADGVMLLASDDAGLFYGACTLHQLLQVASEHDAGGLTLPGLTIVDWPDLPHRGVMLDISRDRVPTLETLFALVDLLSSWKINQLQLYMEHTFGYEGHEPVWQDASPMTGHDILALDAYCRARHVELVPNQNSFGHMHRWLIHPAYNALAECPEGIEHPFSPTREPYSLCPTDPGSLALLRDLYAQLLPHFQSRIFNVGLDETFDIGLGRSKAICEAEGSAAVYLAFLRQVAQLAREHGRSIQFWADIVLKDPARIHEIPGDAIAMIWGYEANHKFAEECKTIAQVGLPFYVCPGTSSWNTFAGRTDNAIGNLRLAAKEAKAHGAIGYLNTDWGDFGHTQPLPVSYLGLLAGAGFSWHADALDEYRREDWCALLDRYVFQDDADVMGGIAYDLGNAYRQTGARSFNASPLFRLLLLFYKHAPEDIEHITKESLAANKRYVEEVIARLATQEMQRADATLVVSEFQWAADVLCFACDFAAARIDAPGQAVDGIDAATKEALVARLVPLIAQHRKQWSARSRPGGLDDSAGQFVRILTALGGEI